MNLSSFDLNLLKVLDAILQEGSTVRAGQRIGLSQPAVSAALGRLRAALGDPLFVRQGQRLVATDFARGLALPLRDILESTQSLLAGHDRFDPQHSTEGFMLSASDFFAEMLMPELAHILGEQAPGMRVQMVEGTADNLVAALMGGTVDIALGPQSDLPTWTDWQPLFHSGFEMIARRGHPRLLDAGVAPGDVVPIDLFCDLGHILFSPEGRLRSLGDEALARIGRKRRVMMTMPVFYGVCSVVAASDHVALIPHQLARRIGPKLGLDLYRSPVPVQMRLIGMAWHHRASQSPAHAWLRSRIAELMLPLNADGSPLPPG